MPPFREGDAELLHLHLGAVHVGGMDREEAPVRGLLLFERLGRSGHVRCRPEGECEDQPVAVLGRLWREIRMAKCGVALRSLPLNATTLSASATEKNCRATARPRATLLAESTGWLKVERRPYWAEPAVSRSKSAGEDAAAVEGAGQVLDVAAGADRITGGR